MMLGGYYGSHMDGADWLGMGLGFVLFWALIALVVIAAVRSLRVVDTTRPARPSPTELLAQRFARGEIDEAEHLARMPTLHEQRF